MSAPRRSPDVPPPLGVTLYDDGAEVAVLARHAEAVDLCLYGPPAGSGGPEAGAPAPSAAGTTLDWPLERVVPLTRSAYGIWWDQVPGILPGQRYGFRVHGPWLPEQGMRYNPAKLLLDPYARAIEGRVHWSAAVYGHGVDDANWWGDGETRSDSDSAPAMPRSVVLGDGFDWGDDAPPSVPWSSTVIYEAHVRGLTMTHPDVPEQMRGTYAALGHPAVIEHLTGLGVTTLELLPIHTFTSEPELVRRGLTNYWGYNTLGFFAPHAGYAVAHDPQDVVDELKASIKALHAAGIEVLLDVVYNHTAEQSADSGATLSWRGLDNDAYYRLDERGRDIDVTGCGNTVDLRQPMVARMVLDSLRHWVNDFHVDGFRFDLAPALARARDDAYDPDHAFHVALRTDPVLSRVKLIAEPWDVGVHGWRTGQFPPPFAEWNDRYRDAVRTFWLADTGRASLGEQGHGVRELATRLAGSQDMFAREDRGPIASVNFVVAHDGFTLADTTAYAEKHNEANGEGNRDGHGDNRSWNVGVEGPSDDPEVLAMRRRLMRNLLATMLVSAGVPMLCAGDEFGRTQDGNNNAYCQDNPVSWLDWSWLEAQASGPQSSTPQDGGWQRDLVASTAALTRLRAAHRVLRPSEFPSYEPVAGRPRLRWLGEHGRVLSDHEWTDPSRRTFGAWLDDAHEGRDADAGGVDQVLLVLHGGFEPARMTLPEPVGDATGWRLEWHSGSERPEPAREVGAELEVEPLSLLVLTAR